MKHNHMGRAKVSVGVKYLVLVKIYGNRIDNHKLFLMFDSYCRCWDCSCQKHSPNTSEESI